jgi:hypothetical protein
MPKRLRDPSVRPTDEGSVRPTDRLVFEPWNEMLPEMHGEIVNRLNCLDRQCLAMTCKAHEKAWYNKKIIKRLEGANYVDKDLLERVGRNVDTDSADRFFLWVKKYHPDNDEYLIEVAKGAVLKHRHSFMNWLLKLPRLPRNRCVYGTRIQTTGENLNVIHGAVMGAAKLGDLDQFKYYWNLGKDAQWTMETPGGRRFGKGHYQCEFPSNTFEVIRIAIDHGHSTLLEWMDCQKLLNIGEYSEIFESLRECRNYNIFDWVLTRLSSHIDWKQIGMDIFEDTRFSSIHTIIVALIRHGNQQFFDRFDKFLESNPIQARVLFDNNKEAAWVWTSHVFYSYNIIAYRWLKKHHLFLRKAAREVISMQKLMLYREITCLMETIINEDDDCDHSSDSDVPDDSDDSDDSDDLMGAQISFQ